jgi:hypothetical protein
LAKGDEQLDSTWGAGGLDSGQPRHHVTDLLSELSYYLYLARKVFLSFIQFFVH